MRTQACGLACVIVVSLFLSACHSGQSALESQIKEDLQKVLNSAVHRKELSRKLTSTPPESHMLNEAHVQMYVLVRARAIQLRSSGTNKQASQLQFAANDPVFVTETETQDREKAQVTTESQDVSIPGVESNPDISPEELMALKELELSQDLYVWVKQTIEVTVDFYEATTDDPAIFDIVVHNDSVIKHNLSIVKNFHERLRLAYSDSLKVSQHFTLFRIPQHQPSQEKFA